MTAAEKNARNKRKRKAKKLLARKGKQKKHVPEVITAKDFVYRDEQDAEAQP